MRGRGRDTEKETDRRGDIVLFYPVREHRDNSNHRDWRCLERNHRAGVVARAAL